MGMSVSVNDKPSAAMGLLVPATNDFDRKKIMSRIQPNSVVCFSVINMMQKRTKSKVLKTALDELYMHRMALEGLARAEVVTVEGASRSSDDVDGGRF